MKETLFWCETYHAVSQGLWLSGHEVVQHQEPISY